MASSQAISIQDAMEFLQKVDMENLRNTYGATGVMLGQRPNGEPAIVFTVPKKLSQAELQAQSGGDSPISKIPKVIRPSLLLNSLTKLSAFNSPDSLDDPLPTDVIEEKFSIMLLKTGGHVPDHVADSMIQQAEMTAMAPWQGCWNCPIPGGTQIAPMSADWVGTAGCAVQYVPDRGPRRGQLSVGVLTNYHVASMGRFMRGHQICQPMHRGRQEDTCATLVDAPDPRWTIRASHNTVDCALLDAHPGFFEGRATFFPKQISPETRSLAAIRSSLIPVDPRPRLLNEIPVPTTPARAIAVWKSGRTTGFTNGYIAGVGNFTVGYGKFSVTFRNQLAIKSLENGKPFSAPGDSGSLILDSANRPVALLFAGGPTHTIASPIEYAMKELGFTFLPQ